MNFKNIITLYNRCHSYPPLHDKYYYLYKINNNLINKIDSKPLYLYHINSIIYTTAFIVGIFVYFNSIINI